MEEIIMFKCKYCDTQMQKVYAFEADKSYQQFHCPNCGSATRERLIEYDDKGYLIDGKKKKKKKTTDEVTEENSDN